MGSIERIHLALDHAGRALCWLLGFLFIAVITPFFLLVFYAHPSADDFCYANSFSSDGFWNHIVGEYMGWKGRYFAIFVTTLFHKSGALIDVYRFPLILLLALFFVALYFLVKAVFEGKGTFARTICVTLALGGLYIATMPKVSAALYWADGAFQYQVGNIFLLFSIASLLWLYRGGTTLLRLTIFSSIFIFAAIGSNEVSMVVLTSSVGLICLQKFFLRKEDRIHWLAVLIVTAISSALVVFAPGNAVRLELAPPAHYQFWFSVSRALYHGSEMLGGWLGQPLLWLLLLAFMPIALRLIYMEGIRKDASWARLGTMAALLVGQIWLCFFGAWWAAATNPPARTLNAVYLVFIVGIFVIVLEMIAVMAKSRKLVYIDSLFSSPVRTAQWVVLFLLGVLYIGNSHVRDAYADLFFLAPGYDRSMKNRYAYIIQQKQNSGKTNLSLKVERITHPPKMLVYTDISRDKNDWRNNCYASYFNLRSVTKQ